MDATSLLEHYKPRLVYDSMEAYFADSAAIWTDSEFTQLNRQNGGKVVVPRLSLVFLDANTYRDGQAVNAKDTIGETTRDYRAHAAAAHTNVHYRNRIHGRVKRDDHDRLWLQYWFFYYYNDFQLAGPLLSGGKHEGDWEMIQILFDNRQVPIQAVYAQHSSAESKPWSDVRKAPSSADTPLVYVARGSHASYFTPGSHWTGAWFDNADGKGPQIDPAVVVLADDGPGWAVWPGRWGDTKSAGGPFDANSPRGPGGHVQWGNPGVLAGVAAHAATAAQPPPAAVPSPPTVEVRRDGDKAIVTYEAPETPSGLVVAVRPVGSNEPAETLSLKVDAPSGQVEVPLTEDVPYQLHASVAVDEGAASPSATVRVPRHN